MATGEDGPATELKPGTYTLLRGFNHELSVHYGIVFHNTGAHVTNYT